MALNRLSTHSTVLLSIFIAAAFAAPVVALAQDTGDVEFNTTTEAIAGTLQTCTVLLGCSTQDITPANPVSEGANGTADNVDYNLTVTTTGGIQVATVATSDNSVTDDDLSSDDSAVATEDEQSVSFFGGAVTYDEVQSNADCIATAPSNGVVPVGCTPEATVTNLEVNGQRVYPSGTQVAPGTQFPLTNVPATLDGIVYELTGTLIIGATSTTGNDTSDVTSTFAPISFSGTLCLLTDLTCALQQINVSIQDWSEWQTYPYAGEKSLVSWQSVKLQMF